MLCGVTIFCKIFLTFRLNLNNDMQHRLVAIDIYTKCITKTAQSNATVD